MKNIPKFRKNKETEGQDKKPQQEPVRFEFHKWLEGVPETEQIEASDCTLVKIVNYSNPQLFL